MISKSEAQRGYHIVGSADMQYGGGVVAAADGTMLSAVVNSHQVLASAEDDVTETTEDYDSTVAAVRNRYNRNSPKTPFHHTKEKEALEKFIADRIGASTSFAKNVVMPIVNEILEDAQEEFTKDPITRIVSTDGPDIINDSDLDEFLASLSSGEPKSDTALSKTSPMVLSKLPASVDDITDFGIPCLNNLAKVVKDTSVLMWSDMSTYRAMVALASDLLLTHAVRENLIPEFDLGSESPLVVTAIIEHRADLAASLIVSLDKLRKLFSDTNLVVTSTYGSAGRLIIVVGRSYRKFLRNGGTPEAILECNMTLDNAGQNNPDNLRANCNRMYQGNVDPAHTKLATERYNSYLRLKAGAARVNTSRDIATYTLLVLGAYVRETYPADSDDRARLFNRMNDYSDANPMVPGSPADLYVTRFVCHVLTDGVNNSLDIILGMRKLMADDGELKPAEAAMIISARLCVDWLLSQVVVGKVS